MVNWTLLIHYDLDQKFTIAVSVLEEGNVPILLSNKQMGVMNLDLINRVECTFVNCPCFDYYKVPVEISTSNHQVIDLTQLVRSPSSQSASAEITEATPCQSEAVINWVR